MVATEVWGIPVASREAILSVWFTSKLSGRLEEGKKPAFESFDFSICEAEFGRNFHAKEEDFCSILASIDSLV